MSTEIRNTSVDPLTLPNPLQGTLKGGEAIVLSTATATLLALIPSLGRSFQVTDLGAGYSGETHDAEFGMDTDEAEELENKTLTTCALGSDLDCGGYSLTAIRSLAVKVAEDLAITASLEVPSARFNFSAIRQWATGALVNQREMMITAPTYRFVGASTLTTAATVWIEGAPIAGANATITNSYALFVAGGTVRFGGALELGATLTLGGAVTCGSNDFNGIGIANAQVVRGAVTDLALRPHTGGGSVIIHKADGTTKAIESNATGIGFYGVAPVARQVLATGGGATPDQIITALQALGLLAQS